MDSTKNVKFSSTGVMNITKDISWMNEWNEWSWMNKMKMYSVLIMNILKTGFIYFRAHLLYNQRLLNLACAFDEVTVSFFYLNFISFCYIDFYIFPFIHTSLMSKTTYLVFCISYQWAVVAIFNHSVVCRSNTIKLLSP